MWIRRSVTDYLNLGRCVVGPELMPRAICGDDWIAGVVDSAWDARNSALCSTLLGAPSTVLRAPEVELPEALFAFGSGAVQLSCDILGLHAIADKAVWRALPVVPRAPAQSLPSLAPLDQATQRAVVRLDVVVGDVEVDLPNLLDLHCGDVLRLPQRLDEGMTVLLEGKPLARAVLGRMQDRMCVQVFANHQPEAPRKLS